MDENIQFASRKLEGTAEHDAALDTLFARPGRSLCIFDRQLGRAYNALARHDLLRQFLLAGRNHQIRIVLHDTANLTRDCPRMLLLMRQFSHAVSIHETEPQAKHVYDPFALIDERDYVHRFHYDNARGVLALDDPNGARTLAQRFGEIWEASTSTVSATTLGL